MREQYETELIVAMRDMLKKSSGHIEAEAHGASITISGSTTHGFQLMLIDCFIEGMIEDGLSFSDCLYMIWLIRKIRRKD